MDYCFEKGCAYFATPVMGGKKRLMGVFGRDGGDVTFTDVADLRTVRVRDYDGREHAIVRAGDGVEYSVCALCKADLECAASVMAVLRQ